MFFLFLMLLNFSSYSLKSEWNNGIEFGGRDTHPLKESFSIKVTEEGISIFFKEEQSSKASHSIEITLGGIVTFFNDQHLLNVFLPIFEIDGIANVVNDEHLQKA